jgi:hypothetical protein
MTDDARPSPPPLSRCVGEGRFVVKMGKPMGKPNCTELFHGQR